MPQPDGTLYPYELEIIDASLQRLWGHNGGKQPCPKCQWGPYQIIPQLNGNRSDTLDVLAPHFRFPTVMVMCLRCGYLDQYLASNLGVQWLLPPPVPAPPATPPSPEYLNALLGKGGGNNG